MAAAIQRIIETKKIELTKIIEFSNQVENTSFSNETDTSSPEDVDGNLKYQLFRFSGKFYVDDLTLHKSPFETLLYL